MKQPKESTTPLTTSPFEEELRKLRGHLAYKANIQPYKVFTDKELVLLLKHTPRTIEDLAKIPGFPADGERVKKYGESIIEIFNRKPKASAAMF